MQWERVGCPYLARNAKAYPRTSAKASLLELPEQRWQTPSVSSPSTVVSTGLTVKIGLSDSV